MTYTYKVLGQSAPAATTHTAAYTVPGATSAIVSTIVICNRESAINMFRVEITDNVGAVANEEYIVYDAEIGANDTITLTLGISLEATKIVGVYASDTNLSFNVFGVEIT